MKSSAGSTEDVTSGNERTLSSTSNQEISVVDTAAASTVTATSSEQMSASEPTSANRVVPRVAEDESESQGDSSRPGSDSNNLSKRSCSTRRSLKDVVTSCEKEWFNDTRTKANEGEVQMQILLAQMYLAGYGTKQDSELVSSAQIVSFTVGGRSLFLQRHVSNPLQANEAN